MFDLLSFLFKLNDIVYTTILNIYMPAYFRYESDKEKTTKSGIKYFYVIYRYLNWDRVFNETSTALGILIFKGIKRIDILEAFPLKYYPRQEEMKEYMMECGKRFVNLRD